MCFDAQRSMCITLWGAAGRGMPRGLPGARLTCTLLVMMGMAMSMAIALMLGHRMRSMRLIMTHCRGQRGVRWARWRWSAYAGCMLA